MIKTNAFNYIFLYFFLFINNLLGKTSVALALCRQLFPPSQLKRRVLELNASDERGISVVRDKIKHFASLTVGGGGGGGNLSSSGQKSTMGNYFQQKKTTSSKDTTNKENNNNENEENYPNPPFKIIILDEADSVTSDAQAALRRIIVSEEEDSSFVCPFIFLAGMICVDYLF